MSVDLNLKCRTCLSGAIAYQLHDYVDENYKILDMLNGIVPEIEFKTATEFSTSMCRSCVNKLIIGYKFQQLCVETNNRLHDLLGIALFKTEPEQLLIPVTGTTFQVKQEIEEDDCTEFKVFPNELEEGMPSPEPEQLLIPVTGTTFQVKQEIEEDDSTEFKVFPNELEEGMPSHDVPNDGGESNSVLRNEDHSTEIKVSPNELEGEISLVNVPNSGGESNTDLSSFNWQENPTSTGNKFCNICQKDFLYYSKWKEHMRIHSGERPFLCSQCGKRFRRKSGLREHMHRHQGLKKFQCPNCPKRYYGKIDLIRHRKVHVNTRSLGKEKNAECRNVPGDKLQEEANKAIESVPLVTVKGEIEIKPELLEESINNFDNLKRHNNSADNSNDSSKKEPLLHLGTKVIKNIDLGDTCMYEIELNAPGRYACETCGKIFNTPSLLKMHSPVHSLARSHECQICFYRFSTTRLLKGHMSKHENGTVNKRKSHKLNIKPACSICKKEFSNNHNLKVHMRLHSDEKSFYCTECGKTFNYASNLKEHMRTHSGESPYQCVLCYKTFRQLSTLRTHNIRHHKRLYKNRSSEEEKEITCAICGNKFSDTSNLKKHFMRAHSNVKPYQCNECGKTFTCSEYLREHMRTHSDERPFQCSQCDKTFRHSSSLRRHMEGHKF